MSTGQDWIDATRRNLLNGYNDQRNKLNAAYTAGGTTLTFKYPLNGIVAGVTLSIGLNIFYVYATDTNAMTATVEGGQDGSTDIDCANGSVVRISPKFTDWGIWQALINDLKDLSSPLNGMFGVNHTDWTYQSNLFNYDLGTTAATNLLDLIEVRVTTPGAYKDAPALKSYQYKLNRNAVEITSGLGLEIKNQTGLTPSYTFRATWKSKFVMPANPSADLSTSLLLTDAYDIPPLGAAIALMAGQEIKRNFLVGEGDMKRALEVPPGAIAASPNGLKQMRHDRINAEAARLLAMYSPSKD